jgi:acetoacetyl-CoA synthetase
MAGSTPQPGSGDTGDILWQPAAEGSQMADFAARFTAALHAAGASAAPAGGAFADYAAFTDFAGMHAASITHRDVFWRTLWNDAGVIGTPGDIVLAGDGFPGARWFPAARLNYAENLLRRQDDGIALLWRDETGAHARMTWAELDRAVREVAAGLQAHGLGIGDRIAAVAPNRPETIVLVLACAAIGAIWSSCSPDFGTRAIVDRFAQVAPAALVGCRGYHYAGRHFDCTDKLAEVHAALPTVRLRITLDGGDDSGGLDLAALRRHGALARFPHFPFAQPLYVLFSSGTTGLPKCITHSAGGTLLKHLAEQRLHCDFRADERVFFFTTCGWMMWNWLVSALACGSTLCLYDGSPFHPDAGVLPRYAEEEGVAHLGISPGFLSQLAKLDYRPRERHDLGALRSVLSTGSPLAPELFRWSYAHLAPAARLSSITGGTDIMGCFALGNPLLPVRTGEIQAAALGMDVAFLDDDGNAVPTGERGELVCRAAFPSVPLGFWNDPDHARFRAAYFDRYPGLWHHGDFGEFTPSGGVIIHGRSDATLNRGGVRIGTAEIYRQLEAFPEILESLAVAQERAGMEVRVVLFLRLRDGMALDDALAARIRQHLRTAASPRHVPDVLLAVPDLPRTRSGKLTELAVREVIHGRPVKNVGALANPEALEHFRGLPELG